MSQQRKNQSVHSILVKIINGPPMPLWYTIDQENLVKLRKQILKVVVVPIRNNDRLAIVLKIATGSNHLNNFIPRPILKVIGLPEDKNFQDFITKVCSHYGFENHEIIKKTLSHKHSTEPNDESLTESSHKETNKGVSPQLKTLNEEQKTSVSKIRKAIDTESFKGFILHGITGSGKTEVYKEALDHCIKSNGSAIFLAPEVSLCLQLEKSLKACLSIKQYIYNYHSLTSEKERLALWNRLLSKKPTIIVGVHIPPFLPIPNLKLTIVDEEHEEGYCEQKPPHANSRDIAIFKSEITKSTIVLGSATPSITTLCRLKNPVWTKLDLRTRHSGQVAEIFPAQLKKRHKKPFWISKELEDAIKNRLQKQEQSIIFINRKGLGFCISCLECGYIPECKNCSVSMKPHKKGRDQYLTCHYCEQTELFPKQCPSCKSDKDLISKGIGTQKAVKLLEKMFPKATILRADSTTIKKKDWPDKMLEFESGNIDIMVGTKSITKGYHFPNVTLVGILWADSDFNQPKFNSRETAIQQLLQVAGRSGRAEKPGIVIAQTSGMLETLKNISEPKYMKLAREEALIRQKMDYPPFSNLLTIEIKNKSEETAETEALKIKVVLKKILPKVDAWGPKEPIVSKIKNYYIKHIILKGQFEPETITSAKKSLIIDKKSIISFLF